jgi:hypothetical protein
VTGKIPLINTSVLASGRKRIQARCKDIVKIIVIFIRKGIHC